MGVRRDSVDGDIRLLIKGPVILEKPLRFRMPLTHEELGHMAGISRETTTRVLSKLKTEGLVEISGERMVLPSPEKLERLYC